MYPCTLVSIALSATNCVKPFAEVIHKKFGWVEELMSAFYSMTETTLTADGPSRGSKVWWQPLCRSENHSSPCLDRPTHWHCSSRAEAGCLCRGFDRPRQPHGCSHQNALAIFVSRSSLLLIGFVSKKKHNTSSALHSPAGNRVGSGAVRRPGVIFGLASGFFTHTDLGLHTDSFTSNSDKAGCIAEMSQLHE